MMYRAEGADRIPQAIHKAYLGDYRPIVDDLVSNAGAISSAISFGLFFAVACNEDVAFIREADIPAAIAGTYLGDYRVRQQQAACAHWPKAPGELSRSGSNVDTDGVCLGRYRSCQSAVVHRARRPGIFESSRNRARKSRPHRIPRLPGRHLSKVCRRRLGGEARYVGLQGGAALAFQDLSGCATHACGR